MIKIDKKINKSIFDDRPNKPRNRKTKSGNQLLEELLTHRTKKTLLQGDCHAKDNDWSDDFDWRKILEEPKPKRSRMVKLPEYKMCRDPGHQPPSHMVIPYGHMYIHVCPTCGQESRIISKQVYY